ncbi:hypothetical protein [Bradyrhizobium sp. 62]|uniref:hypothetical protein n=1 Tax=Bradyrhizobium sp. 62 TaxID=1043588 RepID=UPI001FFBD78F|nr:hypothetical protein [Bradyrhizobium sp. 62]MCK1368254.1 hypothetical protein [Bradyrhizobium sp. 62]
MEKDLLTMLALGTFLIGMIIGIRFRFVILLPLILAASVVLAAAAMLKGETAGHTALEIVLTACLLQLGYVLTALIVPSVFDGEVISCGDRNTLPCPGDDAIDNGLSRLGDAP